MAWSEGVLYKSGLRGWEWKDVRVKNCFLFFFSSCPENEGALFCDSVNLNSSSGKKKRGAEGRDRLLRLAPDASVSKAQSSPLATSHCWGMQVSGEQVLGKTAQERNVVVIKLNREWGCKNILPIVFLQSFFMGNSS